MGGINCLIECLLWFFLHYRTNAGRLKGIVTFSHGLTIVDHGTKESMPPDVTSPPFPLPATTGAWGQATGGAAAQRGCTSSRRGRLPQGGQRMMPGSAGPRPTRPRPWMGWDAGPDQSPSHPYFCSPAGGGSLATFKIPLIFDHFCLKNRQGFPKAPGGELFSLNPGGGSKLKNSHSSFKKSSHPRPRGGVGQALSTSMVPTPPPRPEQAQASL